jgi:hypothetical protein
MSALRSTRRRVGLSRFVSASVHYIRRERGRCLTRGRRFRAGVNKLGKTEPETRSSTKDYADAQDYAVNQRARKSVEGKELAPRERHYKK